MTDKLAVVTGAGRGIGLDVCRQLAERGMSVVLTARDPKKAKAAFTPTHPTIIRLRPTHLDEDPPEIRITRASSDIIQHPETL